MYAYIQGKITSKNPAVVILETGGIGYEINISLQTYTRIQSLDNTRLWIHQHVKEDDLSLYGFFTEDEKAMFRYLISVSGVGPNTARVILSSMDTASTRTAISTGDVQAFKSVKGIGPKTAQRIIIDLRDKVGKSTSDDMLILEGGHNTFADEALSALVALGFARPRIQQIIQKIRRDNPSIDSAEALIKQALKLLS